MLKTLGLSKEPEDPPTVESADSSKENKGLRESSDFTKLFKTVSGSKKRHSDVPNKLGEESKIIGNSLSFFGKDDKQESRYQSDEEEQRDRDLYSNLDDSLIDNDFEGDEPTELLQPEAVKSTTEGGTEEEPVSLEGHGITGGPDSKSQTFSSFLPNMFRNNSEIDNERTSRMFRFRRRKKSKRPSIANGAGIEEPEEIVEDSDRFTGERAQNLIGVLAFATPSLNLIASCLLEDERGISRAPLLLSLLGFRITDVSPTAGSRNRKFRIDLEYGVGPQRLKWSVERSARDLLVLHSRFRLSNLAREVFGRNLEYPKFPMSTFRNERSRKTPRQTIKPTFTFSSSKNPNPNPPSSALPSPRTSMDDPHHLGAHDDDDDHHDRRSLMSLRNLVASASLSSISSDEIEHDPEALKRLIVRNEEYTKQVETYLNELTKTLALTPQSNRLFHFFELSPVSSLLTYETGYRGKQGSVHIGGTAKSQGWRVGHFKANDLKGMIDRRSEKWLLIRHSYIMYVSDINSTLPLDVFLVDSKFQFTYKSKSEASKEDDDSDEEADEGVIEQKLKAAASESKSLAVFKHLRIILSNSERKLTLLPKSRKEQKLWIQSLNEMRDSTVWSKLNRFDSFAPVRDNCFAQWFVDGRDYFWALSSAIEMAKDVVYIHDWWLSPELYLRRPANGNQQWRIDRLLQRKAKQGIKIFIIIYRNVGSTVSIDSLYTKHSLLALHDENIHVIRSPNQLLQNTYFWAHHEKLCVIDHSVAFMGGMDLCYGRYDTPDHVLVDDSNVNFSSFQPDQVPTEADYTNFQIFPGKDYSNPRVKDFHGLDKPYESMYDRNTTPRMPWHDVHMLTSGQVARDLSRHFVQRWNYLLRQKRPSRFTPLLTPPSDFTEEEEKALKLGGSCEIQLIRSSGNWSLGLKQHEQSIQTAYLKLIETSQHFVYIENQFFVTSCEIDGNEIENKIGDALVDRIIRAHKEGTHWRAVIVIPLMPGFESQVDEPDGSSVRVIMQCQYMSISRGQTSIFAKLKRYGIEPADYIQFFSLRKWGIIGPDRTLVTEQLYIHAKIMIVDDRAAIIGSANINERSMRGVRDSEMAAVIRDRETITTKMGGEEYTAGRFAHSLRIRLMREHLGVAVDLVDLVERRFKRFETFAQTPEGLKASTNNFKNKDHAIMSAMVEIASRDILNMEEGTFRWTNFQKLLDSDLSPDNAPLADINELEAQDNAPAPISLPISFNNRTGTHEANRGIREKKKHSYDARVQHNESHKKDVFGIGIDKYKSKLAKRARLNSNRFLKNLAEKTMKPKGHFLPDLDNVIEFLESDDIDMTDHMDEESEKIIHERNKERWLLLKKIAYLQRLHARQLDNEEEENKKRVNAGMAKHGESSGNRNKTRSVSPGISGSANGNGSANGTAHGSANGTANGTAHGTGHGSANGTANGTANGSVNGTRHSSANGNGTPTETVTGSNSMEQVGLVEAPEIPEPNDISDTSAVLNGMEKIEGTSSEDIPIVTLSDEGVKSLIESINPPHLDKFTKFIDPYAFEDPIDEEFFEDLFYEHARRNTEIFRMIFHTQPDDTVESWSDYKRFTKLQRAFKIAQEQETVRRKKDNLFGDLNESSSESDNESVMDNHEESNRKRQSINVKQFNEDIGLLGQANNEVGDENGENGSRMKFVHTNGDNVEEMSEEPHVLNNKPSKRRMGGGFAARRRAAAGERIFDRQTAEKILNEVQGNLVVYSADWLIRELEGGNWFYNTDRIPPIDIFD